MKKSELTEEIILLAQKKDKKVYTTEKILKVRAKIQPIFTEENSFILIMPEPPINITTNFFVGILWKSQEYKITGKFKKIKTNFLETTITKSV